MASTSVGNRLPGIIVTIVPDVGLIAPFGFERFPAIIGWGDIEIVTQRSLAVTRSSSGDTDILGDLVVSLFQIGLAPGITQFHPSPDSTPDFQLVTTSDTDGNPVSAIQWLGGGSSPKTGKTYYISYTTEMPSSAFTPVLYLDEGLMTRERGKESIFSDSALINPLVAAARLAFKNGAEGVLVCQLDYRAESSVLVPEATSAWEDPLNPQGSELDQAYDVAVQQLDKVEEFKLWLVPLDPVRLPEELDPTGRREMGEANNSRWFVHASLASSPAEGRERTLLGNVPQGSILDALLNTASAFAATGGGERFVVTGAKGEGGINPSTVAVTIFSRSNDLVNVSFLNAAMAGLFSASGIGDPNNSAPVSGVRLLADWTVNEAKLLRGGGVIPFKTRSDLTTMLIPITCDTTSAFTEDLSVQDTADYMRAFIRIRLFGIYRNTKITAQTESAVAASLASLLDGLIADDIIVDFSDIVATQRKDEPRLIEVSGRVKPAFPLRWLDVELEFTANL